MKTPEEIKKGLECCLARREYRDCISCPYGEPRKHGSSPCDCEVKKDTLAYIQQIERERDAAVAILKQFACCSCIHENKNVDEEPCVNCCLNCTFDHIVKDEEVDNWQWRGAQEG